MKHWRQVFFLTIFERQQFWRETYRTVHTDFFIRAIFIRENNANGFFPALALDEHCVATEELQLVHFGLRFLVKF